jgi:pimeloyl-ACP methyl ester carboxylesterase
MDRARLLVRSLFLTLLGLGGTGGCADRSSSTAGRQTPTDSAIPIAPADTTWPDPAPHRKGYVSSGNVRIHYLDFGGSGEPLVFLTGLGSSAHIYDDLAPQFTDRFRVIAITRRGHAESAQPAAGYTLGDLVADLRAVLDSLRLARVTLVGHSIAGGELTRFAVLYPSRVARLIYLDAMMQPDGLERVLAADTIKVKPTEADFESYESARAWFQRCFYGFWSPALETDFRINTTQPAVTDSILRDASRNPAWQPEYSRIRAPALVLHTPATLERRRPCVASSTDRARVKRAKAFHDEIFQPFRLAGVERLRREMPQAKIVELQGHHFLFISNQAEVVAAMRAFLLERDRAQRN